MAKSIKPEDLGEAVAQELTQYHERILKKINNLSENTAKELVQETKKTAPKASGDFRKSIASKQVKSTARGNTYAWYVKAPHYRLTHLLVHGHAKQNGGRVPGHPFLFNAWERLRAEHEKKVEEAVKA